MTAKEYQKQADTLIGTIIETLESYDLPEPKVNTIKRIAWMAVDKAFGRFIDEQ